MYVYTSGVELASCQWMMFGNIHSPIQVWAGLVWFAQPICRKVALCVPGHRLLSQWPTADAVVVQTCTPQLLCVWYMHNRARSGVPGWHPRSCCCSSHTGEWPL
jgi:hypothetical protein